MIWLADNREKKSKIREKVFDCGPRRSILLMPGFRCEDAKLAIAKNVISGTSTVILVEENKEVCDEIRRWVSQEWTLELPPLIYQMPLHKVDMVPIDLAYIDLFGNLTRVQWDWLTYQLIPNLMPGCQLSFTFNRNPRGNLLIQQSTAVLKAKHEETFAIKEGDVTLNNLRDSERELATTYWMLFQYGWLQHHSFDVDFFSYRDKISRCRMLLMRLTNIFRKDNTNDNEEREREGTGGGTSGCQDPGTEGASQTETC